MRAARPLRPLVAFALVLALAPSRAAAQGTGSGQGATADALFADGTAAMERGDYTQACPKLAESYRLDPATGSLLALALCHERSGKIASAWKAYRDVVTRTRADRDADRERAASERVAALEKNVPFVQVTLGAAVGGLEGVEIRIDGAPVEASVAARPIAVDPGEHELEVRAMGHEPERRAWTATAGGTRRLEVASLRRSSPAGEATAETEAANDGPTGAQIAGLVVGGAGLVAVGLGVVFGVVALGDASELKDDLGYDPDRSTCAVAALPDCTAAYDAANRNGVLSTVFLVAGGALVAGGVTLVVVGGGSDTATHTGMTVRATPGGVLATGAF